MDVTKTKNLLLACLLAFAMCSIFTAKTFGQQIRRVDSSADPDGNGLSWGTAYNTLSSALDEANDLNSGHWEIWVAQGTYTPLGQQTPFSIFQKSGEFGVDRIVLLGGFAGKDAPNPNLRDPKAFPTILSGDIGGVNGVPGQEDDPFPGGKEVYSDSTRTDNADNVLFVLAVGPGNRIEGFTIEGGIGGARLHQGSNINVGAGMIVIDSALAIVNCEFRYNAAGQPIEDFPPGRWGEGGGAYVLGGWRISAGEFSPTRFINCTFHDNFATRGGGLAVVDGGTRTIDEIEVNILNEVKCINSLFYDNKVFINFGEFIMPIFNGVGGAIAVNGDRDSGGGTSVNYARVEVTNCTVVNNHAERGTGGLRVTNVDQMFDSLVQNSVFWGNIEGVNISSQIVRVGSGSTPSRMTVRYSDVEGGLPETMHWTLEVVIDQPPLFVDESTNNFRVMETSPILDAADPLTSTIPRLIPDDNFDLNGDNNFVEMTPDLDILTREFDSDDDGTGRVNMGAYENFPTCCADIAAFDRQVNVTDLLALLGAWGPCPPCEAGTLNTTDSCPADINRDCQVNVTDLLALLAAWGTCDSNSCNPSSPTLDPSVTSTQYPSLVAYGGQYGPVSDTWTSTSQTGLRLAADEFKPLASTSVTNVNWWGFYEQSGANCVGNYFDSFTVKYYNAALHSGTGQLVPGSVIASFPNISVFPKMATGETLGNGIPLYFYAANHAAVSVTSGTTYFVEIRNTGGDTTGSSGCHWRWAWSIDGTLLYSARKPEGYSSYLSTANPENTMNLALGLDIEIEQMELIPPPPPPPPPDDDGDSGSGGFGKGG